MSLEYFSRHKEYILLKVYIWVIPEKKQKANYNDDDSN